MSLTDQDLTEIRYVILDALDVVVNPRFDSLEGQIDGLGSRVSQVEIGLHETNRRLSSVETRLTNVEGSVTALHNDVIELYEMVR